MENKKLGEEEIEAFRNMEKDLLSLDLDECGVKYTRDSEMEGKIKYSILCDEFGKEILDSFMDDNKINNESLSDPSKYKMVYEILKNN